MKTFEFRSFACNRQVGIPFCARLVAPGDGYGAWHEETQTWALTLGEGKELQVAFFDKRYPHTPFGQFTGGSYNLSTIIEVIKGKRGILLEGAEPDWCVNAHDMDGVARWLRTFQKEYSFELLMTPSQYAQKAGAHCPKCDSTNLEGGRIERDGDGASCSVECLDCHFEWFDAYVLTGYTLPV